MTDPLSATLAHAVDAMAPAVVRVSGESSPATGLAWGNDLVLTAATDDEGALAVTDAEGRDRPAERAGRDAGTGIEVLRVAGLGLTAPPMADVSALKVGHLALALARPGKSARATFGMITTLGDEWRTRTGARIDRYIDTSIVLPGEFGSTAIIADTSGALIGFGLTGRRHHRGIIVTPATLTRAVESATREGGGQRPYLGIATYPVRIPRAQRTPTGQERGLLVVEVEDDSPAARAGLTLGDVVLAFGGVPVEHIADLFAALADARPAAAVTARTLRGSDVRDVVVTVGTRP